MSESELEQFRRQWQQEVSTRAARGPAAIDSHAEASGSGNSSDRPIKSAPAPRFEPRSRPEDDTVPGWNFDDLEEREAAKEDARRLGESGAGVHPESQRTREPQSALEHYEKAVERESQGKLGDSLALYRKAFKLDDRVDVKYKNKHFPPTAFQTKASGTSNTNANIHATNTAHHSFHGPPGSTSDLISSFASEPIRGAPPIIERTPPPPCPIATIPHEILAEILLDTAILDVASFARLALVCKRLAFLVAMEEQIWKRICHGPEFGFSGMHHTWGCTLAGQQLKPSLTDLPALSALSISADVPAPTLSGPVAAPFTLSLTSDYPTYRHMHHARPRLRFAGLYISTVNYVRPGASSATPAVWNSAPVHVVTYYRYLRFFRSGAVLSLLSTSEPAEVVPHLKSENVGVGHGAIAAAGGGAGITAVAKNTLRGRWRLSPLAEMQTEDSALAREARARNEAWEPEPEGHVYIETYGPTKAYTYTMQLALRSAGGTGGKTKNTKLVWRGFWSYNKITDDWAEFQLKNDRAFVWSRVKSWGDA